MQALAAAAEAEAETQPLHEQSKPEDKNKDGPVFDKDWTAVDDVAKDEAVAAPSSSTGVRQEFRQFANERVKPSRAPGAIDMKVESGDLE